MKKWEEEEDKQRIKTFYGIYEEQEVFVKFIYGHSRSKKRKLNFTIIVIGVRGGDKGLMIHVFDLFLVS